MNSLVSRAGGALMYFTRVLMSCALGSIAGASLHAQELKSIHHFTAARATAYSRAGESSTQQPAPTDPQAAQLLRGAFIALTPITPARDVTLSGTVVHMAGSDDETRTGTLKGMLAVGVQHPAMSNSASALLQQLLGKTGAFPSSLTGTGTVTLTEGSTTKSGTVRIATLSGEYTLEEFTFPDEDRVVAFAHGLATVKKKGQLTSVKSAASLTLQSPLFPMPLIIGMVNNPDVVIELVGTENIEATLTDHFRLQNTFSSAPDLKDFSRLTQRDLWVDASTGLPLRLSYELSSGVGPGDISVPVSVDYSNFVTSSGVPLPQNITVTVSGTKWLFISISSVSVNSGVSISDFQLN